MKWREVWPSIVTHTRNLCSAFNPSKYTHTVVNTHTHTHREHTPGAVGSQYCGARGAVGGSLPCSRAPQSWYWRWRERCTFTPPTNNSCRTWDSNLRLSGYKSDSLSIRPQLSRQYIYFWLDYSRVPFYSSQNHSDEPCCNPRPGLSPKPPKAVNCCISRLR